MAANEKMMKESSVLSLIMKMSLPMVIIMIVQVVYNMADIFFIGRTGNALMVAALTLASPLFAAFSAFNTLIGFGGCTAISLALGEGNKDKVKQYSSFIVYASLLLGIALAVLTLIFKGPLLSFLGADASTKEFASSYITIIALGTPFSILSGALATASRADGDSKSAMIGNLTGTLLNILLDPLFISVFKLGCAGAAYATVIGNIVSCIIVLNMMRKKEIYSLSLKDFSLRPEISLHVLKLGIPMAISTLLSAFSGIFSNQIAVSYGNDIVAARGVAGKVAMLIPMIIMGLCMGVQPAISYAFGRRDLKRVRKVTFGTGFFSCIVGTLIAAVCFLFRGSLVSAFVNGASESILQTGKLMLTASLITVPFCGMYQMGSTYLQATGKVNYATLTSLMRQGVIYIPVLYLMNGIMGLNGLIYAGVVVDTVSTIITLLLCRNYNHEICGFEKKHLSPAL